MKTRTVNFEKRTREYLKYKGYMYSDVEKIEVKETGIYITFCVDFTLRHFSQTINNRVARLSWKDLDNPLVIGTFEF